MHIKLKLDLEKAKVVFALLLLSSLFGVVFFQIQMKPARIQPNRLVIVAPSQLFVGREAILTVGAVNDKGEYMNTRNDLIEISILTLTNSTIGLKTNSDTIWSNKLQINLTKGIVEFYFKAGGVETVIIKVRQLEANSHLEDAIAALNVGGE